MGNQQPVSGSGQAGMIQPGDSQPGSRPQQSPAPGVAYSNAAYMAHPNYHGYGMPPPDNNAALQQQNMGRTTSDASMTIMDNDQQLQQQLQYQQQQALQTQQSSSVQTENWLDDDSVPTVFRWEHGGRQVYITGTFNGWSRQIPMHRSGNDFTYIHNLKRGKHAFKFIVDDEWRFAPDQPTVADIEGRINNFIDVTDFKPYTGDMDFEKERAAADYGAPPGEMEPSDKDDAAQAMGKPDRDGEVFSHTMPDLDDYTKEPPPLPPHLRHIILNKPPQLQDTAALPVPQHVALNHLYCTAIKDNMMVLGITQRYKTKFVTTVYYSPCTSK